MNLIRFRARRARQHKGVILMLRVHKAIFDLRFAWRLAWEQYIRPQDRNRVRVYSEARGWVAWGTVGHLHVRLRYTGASVNEPRPKPTKGVYLHALCDVADAARSYLELPGLQEARELADAVAALDALPKGIRGVEKELRWRDHNPE